MIQKIMMALYDLLPEYIVKYIMNKHTMESIEVSKWLDKQLKEHERLLTQILSIHSLVGPSQDITAIRILRYVHDKVRYTSDMTQYKTSEYWATVDDTLESKRGDCEDGATLVYCLCRTAGIPKNQIFLIAGNVQGGGGHCWVRYISKEYPYVSHYLDWCYDYDSSIVRKRRPYRDYKGIIEFPSNSKYKTIWFMANDESGFKWGMQE